MVSRLPHQCLISERTPPDKSKNISLRGVFSIQHPCDEGELTSESLTPKFKVFLINPIAESKEMVLRLLFSLERERTNPKVR